MKPATKYVATLVMGFVPAFAALAQDAQPVSAATYSGSLTKETGASTATVVVLGRVSTAKGPLPGAVIKIANSRQMVVSDADGVFHLTVPAGSGSVAATASYAGFADEAVVLEGTANEVRLGTPRTVVVSKKQSLQAYRKTARKQVRRKLKRVQRANR